MKGCVDCKNSCTKNDQEPCRECQDTYTTENHFPKWEPKQ